MLEHVARLRRDRAELQVWPNSVPDALAQVARVLEEALPCDDFVRDERKRVDVDCPGVARAVQVHQLGRHVQRRADALRHFGCFLVRDVARRAEVADARLVRGVEEDVVRLQVPVYDVVPVQVAHPVRNAEQRFVPAGRRPVGSWLRALPLFDRALQRAVRHVLGENRWPENVRIV